MSRSLVLWSERSRRDLAGIHAYIGQFAPLAAQRFTTRLITAVESLAEHPLRGRHISQDIREMVAIRPYLVVYKVMPEGVVNPSHQARRAEAGLSARVRTQ